MSLLKNVAFALSLSTAMMAVAPSVMAAEKLEKQGKIKHQTNEGVLVAFDESIEAIEAVSVALNAGAEKKEVLALMKVAKRKLNKIESATVNRAKQESNKYLRLSRKALKDGNMGESVAQMVKAVQSYKDLKQIYVNF